jgi:hypothetical protein
MLRHTGWDDYVMISAMVLVSLHSSLFFIATSTRCWIKRELCHIRTARIAITIYAAWSQNRQSCSLNQHERNRTDNIPQCVIGQVMIIPEVYYGAGRHIQYIDPDHFATGYKLNFITQPIYLFAIGLVKISVGLFLLRIAVRPLYRRIIIGIMAFMAFYTTGCFFTLILQCTNLAVQWDHTVKATCWSAHTIKTLSYVNVSLNILTDLLFSVVIPIPLLWSVQMNKRQKSSLMCILGLGVL